MNSVVLDVAQYFNMRTFGVQTIKKNIWSMYFVWMCYQISVQ